MQLILKYQPDANLEAQHDVIYFGSYDSEQMTEEELELMEEWGWREQYNSWSFSV